MTQITIRMLQRNQMVQYFGGLVSSAKPE